MQVPTRVGKNVTSVRHRIKCNQFLTRENDLPGRSQARENSRLVESMKIGFNWMKNTWFVGCDVTQLCTDFFSRPIRKLYLLTKFFRKFSVVSTTNPRVVMETNDHQIPSQVPWRKDWGKSSGLFLLSWKRQNRKKNLNTLLTVEENKTKSFEESVRLLWCNCVLKRQDKEIDPLYAFYGRWEKKNKIIWRKGQITLM